MGEWKDASEFGFDKISEALSFYIDIRGVIHCVARSGIELRHYMRGSKDPFPWETEGRVVPGSFAGSGEIKVFNDGNLVIIWPQTNGKNRVKYENPLSFPDPSPPTTPTPPPPPPPPPPPVNKKLSVSNHQILYGDEPTKLCGVSRLEALWRTTGEHNWHDWGEYSLEWYENELNNSGINYVRHLGVMDFNVLYDHCKRMKEHGIMVEIGVYRVAEDEGILVELGRMGELAELGNVFFDVCNEFIGTDQNEVNIVKNIADSLKRQKCLVSGGAWSSDGKVLSDAFLRVCDVDIVTHHRDWDNSSFRDSVALAKPTVFNEYFAMKRQSPLGEIKRLMNLAFDVGVQGVQYYGFRFPGIPGLGSYDPFDYKDILDYAGKIPARG